MTLLEQMEGERRRRREVLRQDTRRQLGQVLAQLAFARHVIVFGSLVQPGRFHEASDVDLALQEEPAGLSLYQLTSLLGEHLGRPVDIVLLAECRFRDKILREGETWMLPD